jgi:hypothetical protein
MLMVKKKTILKIILAVLALPALVAGAVLAYGLMLSLAFTSGDIPHKADQELIANFQSHRTEFNRLLQMINEDRDLKRVDNDWTFPENPQAIGIAQERIDKYRTLFRQAGVPRGFSAFQSSDYIEFIASSQGLAVSGSSKGYLYAKEPPPRVIDNLDTYRAQESKFSPAFPVFRHIEGNWYLFFEAD